MAAIDYHDDDDDDDDDVKMMTLYFCVILPRPKLHYRNSTFETSS